VAEIADRGANHALRARFEDVYGQYDKLRSGLDDIQQRLATMRVSATSADGLITATVGARGQLLDLKIDRKVYRELDEIDLSRAIVETVARAAARTTAQVQELMGKYLPADSGPMRFLKDSDFGTLLRRQDSIMQRVPDDE
jgi:DNA-binding protein YbaB